MGWFLAGVVCTVACMLWLSVHVKGLVESERLPFFAKPALTEVEQQFYFQLLRIFPDCVVLCQVQLCRFLEVAKGREDYRSWLNRIDRKSADFVICKKADFSVLAVIELDDSSHLRADRQQSDRDKDAFCNAAGIRVIRCKVGSLPAPSKIRKAVFGEELEVIAQPVLKIVSD